MWISLLSYGTSDAIRTLAMTLLACFHECRDNVRMCFILSVSRFFGSFPFSI